jgi:hypothetical protein
MPRRGMSCTECGRVRQRGARRRGVLRERRGVGNDVSDVCRFSRSEFIAVESMKSPAVGHRARAKDGPVTLEDPSPTDRAGGFGVPSTITLRKQGRGRLDRARTARDQCTIRPAEAETRAVRGGGSRLHGPGLRSRRRRRSGRRGRVEAGGEVSHLIGSGVTGDRHVWVDTTVEREALAEGSAKPLIRWSRRGHQQMECGELAPQILIAHR